VPVPRRLLDDDEEVLVDVRPHWVFLSGPATLTLLAVAGAVAIGYEFPQAPVGVAWVLGAMVALPALWLAARTLRWLGVSIAVTTHRLVYRRGLLRRDVVQVRLQRIAEVHLSQTLLERVIGAGRVVVEVQGDPQPLFVEDVRRPRSLQRVLSEQLDALDAGVPLGRVPGPTRSSPAPVLATPATATPTRWSTTAPVDLPRAQVFESTPPHGVVVGDPTAVTAVAAGPEATGPEAIGPEATAVTAVTPPAGSIPDQLIQLDDLRRRGIITDAEFVDKKTELLGRL
jgi:membrane protein YdbS with pleckstrin-like domain